MNTTPPIMKNAVITCILSESDFPGEFIKKKTRQKYINTGQQNAIWHLGHSCLKTCTIIQIRISKLLSCDMDRLF